jgi:hypothetical protein
MKKTNFEYIKGKARTNTPWFRPNPELLNAWKKDFYKIPGIEKYQFWVCGGALEDWKTWDTDIVATGKIDSHQEIEDILVAATQLGFKHRQLIDINWRSCDCSAPLKETDTANVEQIVIAREVTKNGYPSVKLGESLWKIKIPYASKKQIERIKKGISYKSPPVLITEELDFKDIII